MVIFGFTLVWIFPISQRSILYTSNILHTIFMHYVWQYIDRKSQKNIHQTISTYYLGKWGYKRIFTFKIIHLWHISMFQNKYILSLNLRGEKYFNTLNMHWIFMWKTRQEKTMLLSLYITHKNQIVCNWCIPSKLRERKLLHSKDVKQKWGIQYQELPRTDE